MSQAHLGCQRKDGEARGTNRKWQDTLEHGLASPLVFCHFCAAVLGCSIHHLRPVCLVYLSSSEQRPSPAEIWYYLTLEQPVLRQGHSSNTSNEISGLFLARCYRERSRRIASPYEAQLNTLEKTLRYRTQQTPLEIVPTEEL